MKSSPDRKISIFTRSDRPTSGKSLEDDTFARGGGLVLVVLGKLGVKMDEIVDLTLTALRTRLEVKEVVSELVGDVEEWFYQEELSQSRGQVNELQGVTVLLARRIRTLQSEKQQAHDQLRSVRVLASEVRDKFAVDISSVLMASRDSQSLRARVKALESQVALLQSQNGELVVKLRQEEQQAQDGTQPLSNASQSLPPPPPLLPLPVPVPLPLPLLQVASPPDQSVVSVVAGSEEVPLQQADVAVAPVQRHCLLSDVSEAVLLLMFSFLETGEVLATAQCSRFLFLRVDLIFGTDSAIIKPEWAIRHAPSGAAALPENAAGATAGSAVALAAVGGAATVANGNHASAAVTASSSISTAASTAKQFLQSLMDAASNTGAQPVQLSKDVTEALVKKLSATEYKAVLAVSEALKKQTAEGEQLRADKDDLAARLANTETVRDFLVQKLRSAELALKATMKEAGQLRKQALADGEIISYLDLRGQDLDTQNQESELARKHLQASINLQQATFAHAEKRLGAELLEARARLEETETSQRATKKLLVKEVKSLRAQLEVVTKERNIYGAQIRVLKDTLTGGGL